MLEPLGRRVCRAFAPDRTKIEFIFVLEIRKVDENVTAGLFRVFVLSLVKQDGDVAPRSAGNNYSCRGDAT